MWPNFITPAGKYSLAGYNPEADGAFTRKSGRALHKKTPPTIKAEGG